MKFSGMTSIKHRKSSVCTKNAKRAFQRIVLFSFVLLLVASGKGFVDGFVPQGFSSAGHPGNILTGSRIGKPSETLGNFQNFGRVGFQTKGGRGKGPTRRSSIAPTTQLGITVVLPLPLASPRLSGPLIKAAESWAPTVGVVTSTLLYLAPAKAVWKAIRRARNQISSGVDTPMDGLNPLPIALMPTVALSWLAYGLASSDAYLILGNGPGTLLSVAYLIGILPLMNYNAAAFPNLADLPNLSDLPNLAKNITEELLMDPRKRIKPKKSKTLILTHATVLLSTAATLSLWAILGILTSGATDGMFNVGGLSFGMGFSSMLRSGVIVEMLGVYAAFMFLLLSASPLFMIRTVLKTKNSRIILGSLTAAQCVNTGLWTAYGLAVNDHFVWGPNIIVSSRWSNEDASDRE